MQLLDLPVEILAQILSVDISWASVLLWKCGNRILSAKLANGGVQDLSLRDNFRASPSHWPQFITQLSLRSFSYERETTSEQDPLVIQELRKLKGERLISVTINANGAFGAIFPEDSYEGSVGLTSATSASTGASSDAHGPQDGSTGAILPLSVLWPRLEYLKLGPISREPHGLKTGVIGNLPSSLTHLEISCSDDNRILRTLNLPQLRVFRLPIGWMTQEWLESLPTDNCITDLGYIVRTFHQAHLLKYLDCVPNLQVIPVDFTLPYARTLLEAVVPLLPKLPSTLTTLSLGKEATSSLGDIPFPPKLQSLSLAFTERSLTWLSASFAMFASLPLTSLTLNLLDWKLVTDATFWPSSLTSLTVASETSSEPANFALLPRTVTRLDLGMDCFRSSMIVLEDEDTTIEELRAKGRSILDTVDKQRWSTLKHQLIEEGKRPGAPDRTAEIEAIESGALFGLPLELVSLELYINTEYSILHPLLPPRVTRSELKLSEALTKVDLFPASLDHLGLVDVNFKSTHPTWSAFTAQGAPASHSPTSLKTLRSMQLSCEFTNGSVSDFYCLAGGLQDVRLVMNTALEMPVVLQRLPQTLTRLHIDSTSSTGDSKWPSFLPRSITSLYCDFFIASDDYELLPPKLVELHANLFDEPSQMETISALRKLPRSLLKVWLPRSVFPLDLFVNVVFATYRPFSLFFTASSDDILMRVPRGH